MTRLQSETQEETPAHAEGEPIPQNIFAELRRDMERRRLVGEQTTDREGPAGAYRARSQPWNVRSRAPLGLLSAHHGNDALFSTPPTTLSRMLRLPSAVNHDCRSYFLQGRFAGSPS